jgi:hypothetical protein
MALAQLPINKGANINAEYLNNKTPLEYTSSSEIKNFLRQHGGETNDEIWN